MSVAIDWLVEGSVIYHNWWGTGKIEDAQYINERSLEMYAAFPDRPLIHTISNAYHQTNVEYGLADLRKIYTILDEPQTGWVILTAGNPFMRFMGNIVVQMGRKEKARLRLLSDPKVGINFLKGVDGTIPWDAMDTDLIARLDAAVHSSAESQVAS